MRSAPCRHRSGPGIGGRPARFITKSGPRRATQVSKSPALNASRVLRMSATLAAVVICSVAVCSVLIRSGVIVPLGSPRQCICHRELARQLLGGMTAGEFDGFDAGLTQMLDGLRAVLAAK